MPVRYEVHSDPAFVEATYSGTIAGDDLGAIAQEIGAAADKHATPLRLVDCSALESAGPLLDLHAVASSLAGDHSTLAIRESLILPATRITRDRAEYWEAFCYIRGARVRSFEERTSALAWLLEDEALFA